MANDTTTTITQPSPILEGSLTAFLKHLDKLQTGAVPTDYAGIDTTAYAPKVASQNTLQTGAATAAAGLGSLVGTGAGGPGVEGSIASYMSPYQDQVMEAQMAEFDRQAGIQRQGISDQAAQAGAYGGGRHGVQMAEYAKGSDMNRALLQGQLLQQGFQQGQGARAQDLAAQQGLGQYQQAMGQAQQGYQQAILDANQIAGREAEFAPYTQMGLVGQQLAQIQPGAFPTTTVGYAPPAQPASPMSQFLTGAAGGAGIMGKLGLFG
tara:strand:+ start:2360 stop:3154 length:795 start_codon:yes stop_codon:yes gene_type:complete